MVYYIGQNQDYKKYLNKKHEILKNMGISEEDITFLFNFMPITIGCNFHLYNPHPHIKNAKPIYEINLDYVNFSDLSLKGILHIIMNDNMFVSRTVNYYQKYIANFILLPKNYYIKFEKEYMVNVIFDELSSENISLCNFLIKNFKINKKELEFFFNYESYENISSIEESIYNFVDLVLNNENTVEDFRMEFFNSTDETTLDIIIQNMFVQIEGYNNKVILNNRKRKR